MAGVEYCVNMVVAIINFGFTSQLSEHSDGTMTTIAIIVIVIVIVIVITLFCTHL